MPLPSPSQLRRKILIKNKRLKAEDEKRECLLHCWKMSRFNVCSGM